MDMKKMGTRIKEVRKAKGYRSQDQLAQTLRETYGLKTDRPMVGKWEIGYQMPELATVQCLADLLGVSMDYLTCREDWDSNREPMEDETEKQLLADYRALNPGGKARACEYLGDLAGMKKHTAPIPPQAERQPEPYVALRAVARHKKEERPPQEVIQSLRFDLEKEPGLDGDEF